MKIIKLIKGITLCLLIFSSSINSFAKEIISINNDWGFSIGAIRQRGVFPNIKIPKTDQVVNLPHTWNTEDFMNDGGYYRGLGSYVKSLQIPFNYKGKRLFLKFEGAGTVANVFVNRKHVGEHKGAYNAFTIDITDYVVYGEANNITVICDNSLRFDVAPQSGDFNMYGGLYRDAWLIVSDEDTCISPMYYGSTGVLVTQKHVSEQLAELSAEIYFSTKSNYKNCEVEFQVLDATDKLVTSYVTPYINNDRALCNVNVYSPHLWNGKADPYLYKAVAILKRNGKEIDRVEENIGLRYFNVDPDKGFFLNGKNVKLNGVCRHQDWADVASALKEKHHLTDYEFFDEMGANALRLAHYPQAKFMYQEADKQGYIVWAEIPFIGSYVDSEDFDSNLKLQLKELIIQNYNHPSICFWGVFNEILGDFDAITANLNDMSHLLDPNRMTVSATYKPGSFNFITDGIAWNKYFGWYYDKFEDFGPFFDDWHNKYPNAKIGLSEYGAGGSINHHVSQFIEEGNPRTQSNSRFHPEERQTFYHINHIKMIAERDYIWGSFIWNMFDFASAFRTEGEFNNVNDKGLITHDRKNRKDAFYLYKANWNKKLKTTHLCSKNYTIRKEKITDIVVFTTAPLAKLYINGKLMGSKKTNEYATVIWKDIEFTSGKNFIEIKTAHGNDSSEWIIE